MSGSFIELPRFDFNLTGMGEFVQLPGLIDAIRSVINTQVANLAVLPNKVVVPLAPNVDVTKLYFPEPDGIVRMKVCLSVGDGYYEKLTCEFKSDQVQYNM